MGGGGSREEFPDLRVREVVKRTYVNLRTRGLYQVLQVRTAGNREVSICQDTTKRFYMLKKFESSERQAAEDEYALSGQHPHPNI